MTENYAGHILLEPNRQVGKHYVEAIISSPLLLYMASICWLGTDPTLLSA